MYAVYTIPCLYRSPYLFYPLFSSAKPLAILNLEHFLYSLKVELFVEKTEILRFKSEILFKKNFLSMCGDVSISVEPKTT